MTILLHEVVSDMHFQYMGQTGTVSLWYKGLQVPRYRAVPSGSRQFFRLGEYFIKAEYVFKDYSGQCADEIYIQKKISPPDKKYFTKLLACSDVVSEGIQWTMFPWYNLTPASHNSNVFEVCYKQVVSLCRRYQIYDVAYAFNTNWYIHNGRPLIVDCGIGGQSE